MRQRVRPPPWERPPSRPRPRPWPSRQPPSRPPFGPAPLPRDGASPPPRAGGVPPPRRGAWPPPRGRSRRRLDRLAEGADHHVAGADRVVVTWNRVVDWNRVDIRVHQADDRDPQASRLAQADLLGLQVDDHDRLRQLLHVADTAEVVGELGQLGLHRHPLLRRQQVELALRLQRVELVQAVDPLRDRLEVGQQAAEPALVDIGHAATVRPLLDAVACLLLGADEEDRAALAGDLDREVARLIEQLLRLRQVDDVDAVALAPDVTPHSGVPAARLMAEVEPCFEQVPDIRLRQFESSLGCCVLARWARGDPAIGRLAGAPAGQDPVRPTGGSVSVRRGF